MKKRVVLIASKLKIINVLIKLYAFNKSIYIKINKNIIKIKKGNRVLQVHGTHLPYTRDLINYFDYYWNITDNFDRDSKLMLKDYSKPNYHSIRGFSFFPVFMPSIPEAYDTNLDYINLLNVRENGIVLDLGAYSGLSALQFALAVGVYGQVIAVEADPLNFHVAQVNIERFKKEFSYSPSLINRAIWNEDSFFLKFKSDGSLGSAVASYLERSAVNIVEVKTITLSSIVKEYNLDRVDYIKADVEGSEFKAFSDTKFFEKFHPKIIFEPANEVNSDTKLENILLLLNSYGYKHQVIKQPGSGLPYVLSQ